MIIKKDSKFVNLLKTFMNEPKTKDFSTEISAIKFSAENNEIVFYFNNYLKTVSIKEDVDFNATVGKLATTLILASLENSETVEVTKTDSEEIKIGDFKISTINYNNGYSIYTESKHISFTKEQFNKLENDFKLTISNSFANSKVCDVIGIGINEGVVYEVIPNMEMYCIKPVEAAIDTVFFEQTFGHSSAIKIIPKIIFDIFKEEENVFYDVENNTMYSNNISLLFSVVHFKTSAFKEKLKNLSLSDGVPIKNLFNVKKIVSDINKNYKETFEDSVYVIENGKLSIGNCVVATVDMPADFYLTIVNTVLEELLNRVSENALINIKNDEENYEIIVSDNGNYYFLPCLN